MQAQAAESSGYAGQFCCAFRERVWNSLFQPTLSEQAVNRTRKRLIYSYLARNERVAS